MHYIGMDCHITTLNFAVVNDVGRLVKSCKVATSVKSLMEFVKMVPPPRIIYVEEGTTSVHSVILRFCRILVRQGVGAFIW
jgi:hypothetical protein